MKTQIYKTIQSGGFLVKFFGLPLTKSMFKERIEIYPKNVAARADFDLTIKGSSETIENEVWYAISYFSFYFLANLSVGNEIRATRQGRRVIRAGKGTIRVGQNF